MNNNLLTKYIWLVDTLMRHGNLTLEQINSLWMRSHLSDGQPMARRTFFHYRRGIEETFRLEIKCNSAYEYYIEQSESSNDRAFINWMLNSFAAGSVISDSADTAAGRIAVEEVPSAREFLPTAVEALRHRNKVRFTYASFSYSRPESDILFSPYFLKLYKQRWYMIGLRERSGEIRTYALDRVKDMVITSDTFVMPDDADPHAFFEHLVGISSSKGEVRTVRLRTSKRQAKYLRALPLHPTQQEVINNNYSIFTYRVKINYELVHEIIAMGPDAKVLEPPELQTRVTDELRRTLALYL